MEAEHEDLSAFHTFEAIGSWPSIRLQVAGGDRCGYYIGPLSPQDQRLIGAAPDLLQALQRTLNWLASYQAEAAMGKTGPYEQARAAIAKAGAAS